MINLIYTLAFTQVLTALSIIILAGSLIALKRKIRRLEHDEQISRAIRKYEMRWGE